jgi:rhomboid family GlyGly-CTERM serine protease
VNSRSRPLWTAAIAAAAIACFAIPQLAAALVYNREAIANGEMWRLVSGNLAHLSIEHFLRNLTAFVLIGVLTETSGYRYFGTLCLGSAALIGGVLYVLEPGLLVYGGLSGLVTAAIVYYCLHGLWESNVHRIVCSVVLICMAVKISLELKFGHSLFDMEPQTLKLVPLSHVVGAASAGLLFAIVHVTSKLRASLEGLSAIVAEL